MREAVQAYDYDAARPIVLLSEIRAAFLGHSLQLDPHKLAVATIVVGLETEFELDFFEGMLPRVHRRRIALIPPDILHHLRSNGQMLFLYLDPLSTDYSSLDTALLDRLNSSADATIAALAPDLPLLDEPSRFLSKVSRLFDLPETRETDPRLERVLRAIDATPQDFVSVDQAADFACMSVSRFQHVFKDVTGTTFRRYRLWKRMAVVAKTLSNGGNLTEAALEAGFSSSSHLSTAFKDMFGLKPSELLAYEIDLRI